MTRITKPKKKKYPKVESLYPLLSKAVMLRDGYRCRICGGIGTEAAHIFSKGARKDLALYMPNVLWACHGCHMTNKHNMHNDRDWFMAWWKKNMGGEEFYYELKHSEPPYKNTLEAKQYLIEAIERYARENEKKNIPSYLIRHR